MNIAKMTLTELRDRLDQLIAMDNAAIFGDDLAQIRPQIKVIEAELYSRKPTLKEKQELNKQGRHFHVEVIGINSDCQCHLHKAIRGYDFTK